MPTFPFALVTHPVTRTIVCPARINLFENGKEQRHASTPAYYLISVTCEGMKAADAATLQAFFVDAKGQFETDIDITINGVTYDGCSFEQDELIFGIDDRSPELQSAELRLRQTIKQPGSGSGSSFPALAGGVITQMPFRRGVGFSTEVSQVQDGRKYTRYNIASARRSWELNYASMTESEATALENFFRVKHGPVVAFSFTDPQIGGTFANCRFVNQSLELRHVDYEKVQASVQIQEFIP